MQKCVYVMYITAATAWHTTAQVQQHATLCTCCSYAIATARTCAHIPTNTQNDHVWNVYARVFAFVCLPCTMIRRLARWWFRFAAAANQQQQHRSSLARAFIYNFQSQSRASSRIAAQQRRRSYASISLSRTVSYWCAVMFDFLVSLYSCVADALLIATIASRVCNRGGFKKEKQRFGPSAFGRPSLIVVKNVCTKYTTHGYKPNTLRLCFVLLHGLRLCIHQRDVW